MYSCFSYKLIHTVPFASHLYFRFKSSKMAENIEEKIKSYRTAPFDARFPNTNQTRNCFQNYLGEDMDQRVVFDYPFYILDNCSDV